MLVTTEKLLLEIINHNYSLLYATLHGKLHLYFGTNYRHHISKNKLSAHIVRISFFKSILRQILCNNLHIMTLVNTRPSTVRESRIQIIRVLFYIISIYYSVYNTLYFNNNIIYILVMKYNMFPVDGSEYSWWILVESCAYGVQVEKRPPNV